jgi:hypothetical protein
MGNTITQEDIKKYNNFQYDDDIENNRKFSVPKEFKETIFNKLVLPYYTYNIEYEIKSKDGWSKVSVAFLSLSTFLIGGASLMSFACGFYPNNTLNFIAGSIGLLSIIFKEFATYANSIDHIKTLTLNELLKNVEINHTFVDTSTNYKMAIERKNKNDLPSNINKISSYSVSATESKTSEPPHVKQSTDQFTDLSTKLPTIHPGNQAPNVLDRVLGTNI